MPALTTRRAFQIAWGGACNLLARRPIAISLEVTHACNCDCAHCDKGGPIAGEVLAPPERFGEITRELRPLVAQISGGEPLLRRDALQIVEAVRRPGRLPHVIFVTNAALLTEDLYLDLRRAGVDEFSISLDFPDERHDANRGVRGLYSHLSRLLPRLAAHGKGDITLIAVIRKQNLEDLPAIAEHALRWNVAVNFSAYTPLRTGEPRFLPEPDDLPLLRERIDGLIRFKRRTGRIFTAESTLEIYYRYFAAGGRLGGCRAGYRSLVVNPDGRLAPCAMQPHSFEDRASLIAGFARGNRCEGCCVSMRANTEKTAAGLLADGLRTFRAQWALRGDSARS